LCFYYGSGLCIRAVRAALTPANFRLSTLPRFEGQSAVEAARCACPGFHANVEVIDMKARSNGHLPYQSHIGNILACRHSATGEHTSSQQPSASVADNRVKTR